MTNLTRLRLDRGLSGRDLARIVGVSHATIYRLEGGQPGCHVTTRYALERFFSVALEDLLSETTTTGTKAGR